MIWLALIPLAAVVAWLWFPRRAPVSPFPPVTDTVAGFADRTRGERLSEGDEWLTNAATHPWELGDPSDPHPYDWDNDPKDAA